MIGISFVISTTGARQAFLDEVILPGIFEQPLEQIEIVICGRYAGRHLDRVTVVEAPAPGELFYKPFQLGVEAATQPWIVDLDDDFLLGAGWGKAVAGQRPEAGIYGFRMLLADGSLFGTYFDAVDNRLSGRRRSTSYFASYLAPRELFDQVPYPTYESGDRSHALKLRRARPELPWRLLQGAEVLNAGHSMRHPGLVPKTTLALYAATKPLKQFLRANGVAWMPFADRYLDGRPDVSLDDVWAAARAAVGDPDLAQRHHWLE
jgi:hypothetical protein